MARRLFRREEYIVGRIRHPQVLACLSAVAASCGRFAALRMDSLYRCHLCHHTVPTAADNLYQQPGDRVRIGRWHVGRGLAGDLATVVGLPGRTREVPAEGLAVLVVELGVRG